MPAPNNVTRMLDQRHIPYTTYDLPAEKLGAIETAHRLGVSPEIVFKTIVATRPIPGSKPILAVIPGHTVLDLKALAAVLKEKKIQTATQREAEILTGMQVGGISPLGLINRGFQIFLDQSAMDHEFIHISGGMRGLNIRLPVKQLIKLTGARLASISIPASAGEGDE